MQAAFVPQDPDYDSRVRASFAAQAMMTTLHAEIADLAPGRVDIDFPHQDGFTQQHGFTHAGVIATVMDSACGYAAFSLMPDDAAVLTVEYKINLIRPAQSHRYRASGHVVKSGRTLTICQGSTYPIDEPDEPIAIMTGTLMAIRDARIQH